MATREARQQPHAHGADSGGLHGVVTEATPECGLACLNAEACFHFVSIAVAGESTFRGGKAADVI